MESHLSCLSSLKDEDIPVYIQPHYKESYRLAIYALLCGGKDAYEDFLRAEQISHFLSEEEILFILENAELPVSTDDSEGRRGAEEPGPSTYFPTESDEEVPDLDLGWPEVTLDGADTNISLLFHPPRQNTPAIKEVVRKQIQDAKQVIAIAMDVFTDVDIFKELISATLRGVVVYVLLDESHIKSFLTMSQRVGVVIDELKNLRVRTVQGTQYQCQSGVKFHGALEQRFILVDCQTVLYGTYSYSWSFEKINLSMVLVITGQLVCSYDEEFRRLFARSTVPVALSKEKASVPNPSDAVPVHSPNSSQLSLHQIHMRSRLMHGFRGGQDKRFNSAAMLSRGLSVQEKLHQSHCPDMGNLVRGHSYGGELQRMNSMTRLKMGTKDFGAPAPERTGSNLWGPGDMLVSNQLSQQHLKHRKLYGADQLLIPFNSETSLHRWKIDSYLSNSDAPLDASHEMISPYSSYSGLNDIHMNQSQLHGRSRDIKSRLEEMRQKRLSLQEYANLRQSQESLRSMYPTLERAKFKSSFRGLDIQQSVAESELDGCGLDTAGNNDKDLPNPKEHPKKEGERLPTRAALTDAHRSASHYDIKTVPDRKTKLTYEQNEPLSRTVSATDLETSLSDPSLRLCHLQSSGLNVHTTRPMESLTEIPEEREGSNPLVNTLDGSALKDAHETMSEDERAFSKHSSVKSSTPVEMQRHGRDSSTKVDIGSDPAEGKNATSKEAEKRSQQDAKSSADKDASLQRKNSMRLKMYSMLISDERKTSKKEEKLLQRKGSVRSPNASQVLRTDSVGRAAATEQTKNGPSPILSRSHIAVGSPAEPEKQKSSFQLSRLSPQHSSKRKMITSEQERGSRFSLDSEGTTVYQSRREKAYSRFEYFVSSENVSSDKLRTAGAPPPDKDRNSFTNNARHAGATHGYQTYQTQSSSDNKLGRFMQRVGNLISKNK
ncbi:uncharacterized protein LOC143017101 [Genypterus blacodes]|uniref:uncharacterized protein LOC143017101 n=1 Tax=Genypterus blacodes TaxID=154954 RepID=UPI003F768F88